VATEYSARFAKLVTDALAAAAPAERASTASNVAQTLLSTASGVKHQVSTREEFLARLAIGVDLLLPALTRSPMRPSQVSGSPAGGWPPDASADGEQAGRNQDGAHQQRVE
jgi:hypothetical protein